MIGGERTDQISVQSSDDLQGIHSTSFLDQMLIKPFAKSTNQRQDNDDFITENALMGVKWGFVAWLLTAISKYDFFQNRFDHNQTSFTHKSIVFLLLYSW